MNVPLSYFAKFSSKNLMQLLPKLIPPLLGQIMFKVQNQNSRNLVLVMLGVQKRLLFLFSVLVQL